MHKLRAPGLRIAATYMRGGTSKGLFFQAGDLPADPAERDRVLLRAMGSPDPYGVQIDGMGGGSSSTSKVVLLSRSTRPGHDVDYLFGAVDIGRPLIDWSGNCGNLSAAVGPCAIALGLVAAPADGQVQVRIWQANLGKTILATVRMRDGAVEESGDFMLDGVAFPGCEVRLEFLDPGGDESGSESGALLPTGRPLDHLTVPGLGTVEVTLINAGNPTVFMHAADLGLRGTELRHEVNARPELLALAEQVRVTASVAMGLAATPEEAGRERPATPKLALVAPPQDSVTADGRHISASEVDLMARIFSMGLLHHAMTGTGAVAIAAAAAVPGTVLGRLLPSLGAAGSCELAFAHPSGVTRVAADARQLDGGWSITRVALSRSARVLMHGQVHLPG